MARLNNDGSGIPPICTVGLPAPTVVPIIGPSGGSVGLGTVNVQCLVMSTVMRAARAPSIQTVAEPRKTSYSGKKPPQTRERPMSPQRAAEIALIRVCIAPDRIGMGMTGPVLGSGTGTGLG